ncbi:unnamed protein product, partial [Didymodactylos carnosus]
VLEKEGHQFHHISCVIFALPVFGSPPYTIEYFVHEFKSYKGPIPVLIIDQDMHRLAVHCAKRGYIVSELNPADSHGIVGEYWQNKGPGTEEKLALTTAALLTQHHATNPHVLDVNNYRLIDVHTRIFNYNDPVNHELTNTQSKSSVRQQASTSLDCFKSRNIIRNTQ